ETLAEEAGIKNIYISTNHDGLYEKYGYEFFRMMKDMDGEDSRVYVRRVPGLTFNNHIFHKTGYVLGQCVEGAFENLRPSPRS
ncbi:MAG: hypothetical protein IKK75_09455, partial [Clostridia bacterium]|nr:hypothetical protein [Clostridia bacterium]